MVVTYVTCDREGSAEATAENRDEHGDIPIAPVRTAPAPTAPGDEIAAEVAVEIAGTGVSSSATGPEKGAIEQMEVRLIS